MQIVKLFLFVALVGNAKAQVADIDILAKVLTMTIMEPTLAGGRRAQAGELPLSQWLGFCTATWSSLPGESKGVVVTAAHCISNAQQIAFTDRQFGTRHTGRCYAHPQYNSRTVEWDFAMCEVSPGPNKEAVVAMFDSEPAKVGDGLIMAGYGRNPNAGVLHLGASVVYAIRGQDIVTNTSVSLTSGDSGGVLYRGPTDLKKGPFKIIGINSRRAVNSTQSYMNQTRLATNWFKSRSDARSLRVCGINEDCGNGPSQIPEKCLADKEVLDHFIAETAVAKKALDVCVKQ